MGEFGLIDHLTRSFPVRNESTHRGVGDDCAVINYGNDRETLVTTDLLLEGIHFDLTYVPLMHLGYKAIVVNLSDVYAMNGTPRQVTVSLGISKRFTLEHIEQLYEGMRIACEHYGVDLVGGDTSASVTGLIISVTCLGEAAKDDIIYRSARNIAGVKTSLVNTLNVYDILNCDTVVLLKDAVAKIEEVYA